MKVTILNISIYDFPLYFQLMPHSLPIDTGCHWRDQNLEDMQVGHRKIKGQGIRASLLEKYELCQEITCFQGF